MRKSVTMTTLNKIGATLKNRFKSGEKSEVETDKNVSDFVVVADTPTKGGNANSENKTCKKCEKTWDSVSPKNASVQCCHCLMYFCFAKDCANMKKGDFDFVSRDDIFWACFDCKMILTGGSQGETPKNCEVMQEIENLKGLVQQVSGGMNKFAADVKAFGTFDPEGKCAEALRANVDKMLSDIVSDTMTDRLATKIGNGICDKLDQLSGDDSPADEETSLSDEDFPADGLTRVMNKKERRAIIRESKQNTESLKIMQAALASQKEDEERVKNILVYRLPETLTSAEEARKQEKADIETLLEALDVSASPVEIKRLGKFDKDKVKDKPRPVKVTFSNKISRDEAITNARNLGKVTDEKIKNLQICYDLNKDQREQQKAKLDEAKELTKNSATHVWRVRGTPGNMFLKQYERRQQTHP